MPKEKILAIKFKYLGDVAIAIPSLHALKQHFPTAELHVLVAQEAAPIVENLPWIDRIWALPRTRGKARLSTTWPLLRALRQERFTRSVDFAGNDRGALISRIIGARHRLGPRAPKGFFGRRLCYTQTVEEADTTRPEVVRDWTIISPWGVPFPQKLHFEIQPDPTIAARYRETMGANTVVCHLTTSQPKKEWPATHWQELLQLAHQAKIDVKLSAGPSIRERALLQEVQSFSSKTKALPPTPDLRHFIGLLSHAACLVSPDTAPVHLAAGLGIPTISLFGPTAASRWAPLGEQHKALQGAPCPCSGHWHHCKYLERPCITTIQPQQVFAALTKRVSLKPIHSP